MQKLGAIPVSRARATPEGLASHLKSEMTKWSPLIKQAEAYID